jgi:predicted site-specific integrase-resolvase
MVMAIQTNRKLISTREAAKILGISMGRLRRMALDGMLWSEHMAANARVFDEAEIKKLAKVPRVTGRKRGGFRPG